MNFTRKQAKLTQNMPMLILEWLHVRKIFYNMKQLLRITKSSSSKHFYFPKSPFLYFQNLHFFISKISVILFPKFQLYNLFTQSLRPDYADGIYNLGDIYSCMGKTEEAIEWMSKAIE